MPIKREPLFPFSETMICSVCGLEMETRLGYDEREAALERGELIPYFCANDHKAEANEKYPRLVYYTQKELDDLQRAERKRKPRGG